MVLGVLWYRPWTQDAGEKGRGRVDSDDDGNDVKGQGESKSSKMNMYYITSVIT